ncbi:radical SAM protein [Candidatus Pyrohabitans sp.]
MVELKRAEIHRFEEFGKKFLLDVKRNSVYIIDELTFDLLGLCSQPMEERQIFEKLAAVYSADSIRGTLNFLKDNRILIAEEEPTELTFQPLTNKFSITLNVAQSCNLRCRYCYVEKAPTGSRGSLMSEVTAKKGIDFILGFDELESLGVSFYGGEPLLNYPVVKSAMLYASRRAEEMGLGEVEFHITTNGTLLSDEILEFFKDYNINVLISLDGPPEVHDSKRVFPNGYGTHQIVQNNLKKLLATEGIHHVSASAVVTRDHRLRDAYEYLSQFDLRDIKISYVRYQDGGEFALTESQKQLYLSDMREIARDCIEKISRGERPPYYNFETKILQLWKGSRKKYFCPAGIRRFGISPNGDIYPCGVAAAQGVHRIGDVHNGLYAEKTKRFLQKISIENRDECANCWARYLCAGGCFLLLVRDYDSKRRCEINLRNTELAIAIFALIREKNELLLSSLLDPTFLPRLRKLIPVLDD